MSSYVALRFELSSKERTERTLNREGVKNSVFHYVAQRCRVEEFAVMMFCKMWSSGGGLLSAKVRYGW